MDFSNKPFFFRYFSGFKIGIPQGGESNFYSSKSNDMLGMFTTGDQLISSEKIKELASGFSNGSNEFANNEEEIDEGLSKYLKHKPPILLVDKIIDLVPGIHCKTSLKLGGKLARGPYLPQTLEGLGKTTKAVLGKK